MQIGLDPPARVVIKTTPVHLTLLDALRHGGAATPRSPAQERLVRELDQAGLLETTAEARPAGVVSLQDHGLGAGVERLRSLLAAAGPGVTSAGPADLVVACSAGPLPRAVVDPWLAEGTPHLVVAGTGVPGSLRVGPLVEPGRTACLRCVDAAESAQDPRRTLIIEQLAARSPVPIRTLTLELALVWAARDIATFLAGECPATWSATLDAHTSPPVPRFWPRHPDCGCCWDELPY